MTKTGTGGRRRASLAALAAVLMTGLLVGGGVVSAAQADDLARVRREVADLRGQTFVTDIDPVYVDRRGLRLRLIESLRADPKARQSPRYTRALRALGLATEGVPLLPQQLDAATVGIVGLYLPERDEMILVGSDDGELSGLEEWTFAHELVHALQDQRFGLDALFEEIDTSDDDVDLALSALIEGDASAVDTAYLDAHPEIALGVAGGVLGTLSGARGLAAGPPLFAHQGNFTYGQGEAFVDALRDDGGWEAVDAAYADPPVSTEQILHPEKYIEARDDPTPVALPDPASGLGDGWTLVHENALGELQTAVLLANQEESGFGPLPEATTTAAAGWDGDRYALWTDGEAEVLVWRSVWDDDAEAAEFVAALRDHEEARTGQAWTAAGGTGLIDSDRAVRLRRVEDEVTYVVAPTISLAGAALTALRTP